MFNFVENSPRLNFYEHKYWKRMFEGQLKVGTEIEIEFYDEDNVEYSDIERNLKTNSSYQRFGINTDGVASVKGDGSLRNGVEIVTNGRLFTDVRLFIAQYKKIFDACDKKFTREVSQRTGLHMHFLLPEDGTYTQMEKSLNKVIFKNLCILTKKYLPEMIWISAAQNDDASYTRYSGFSTYKQFYKHNFNTLNLNDLRYAVQGENRYSSLNLQPMKINNDCVNNFHIEFRFCDGGVTPTQIALLNYMLRGLIMLSIDVSLCGELIDELDLNSEHYKKLLDLRNNPSGTSYPDDEDRYSNNSGLDVDYFKAKSSEFIDVISDYLEGEVYNGLQFMCYNNVSSLFKIDDNRNLEDIENILNNFITVDERPYVDNKVMALIINKKLNTNTLSEVAITAKENGLNLENLVDDIAVVKKHYKEIKGVEI